MAARRLDPLCGHEGALRPLADRHLAGEMPLAAAADKPDRTPGTMPSASSPVPPPTRRLARPGPGGGLDHLARDLAR